MWRRKLSSGARGMLDALLEAYPDGLSRAELAERIEMELSGGAFRTYLSQLRTNGLIVGRDPVRVSDDLFVGAA